jgi:signal peptidase I
MKKTTHGVTATGPGRDPYAALRALLVHRRGEPPWVIATLAASSVVLGLALGSLFVSRVVPFVAGWDVTAVAGGSMGPRINAGDLIAYRDVDPTTLTPGTVIVFDSPTHDDRTTVHRVVRRLEDGSYVTRGDANPTDDSTPVSPGEIRGAAVMVAPFAGYPSLWLEDGNYAAFGGLIAVLIGASWASVPRRPVPHWDLVAYPRLRVDRLLTRLRPDGQPASTGAAKAA